MAVTRGTVATWWWVRGGLSKGVAVVALFGLGACARGHSTRSPQSNSASADVDPQPTETPSFARSTRQQAERARYWKLLEGSRYRLAKPEVARIDEAGFVVTTRFEPRSYVDGYKEIFRADLPVYVSADLLLDVMFRSYDDMLMEVEQRVLVDELGAWLDTARHLLEDGQAREYGKTTEADVDLYLSVAATLLEPARGVRVGSDPGPVRGANPTLVERLVALAAAGTGFHRLPLFGLPRDLDFSQFTPRGHYTKTPRLRAYFKAMMWLGRVDLRFTTVSTTHQIELQRRQLNAALAIRDLAAPERARWQRIDELLRVFVGERDSASVPELDRLLTTLGAKRGVDVKGFSDDEVAAALAKSGAGRQRILSHVSYTDIPAKTKPLHLSFVPFGQRYVVDSAGFAAVTFDRIPSERFLPSPLDAAYATLGNNHAYALLESERKQWTGYDAALQRFREQTDQLAPDTWDANLYNAWLGALRELSPAAKPDRRLPDTMQTQAWAERLLSTQLASWAQLRHNTILYVKQSYSVGILCEFPDAYVDPYPEFWRALGRLGDRGGDAAKLITQVNPKLGEHVRTFFERYAQVSRRLEAIAVRELSGKDLSQDDLVWINQMIQIHTVTSGGGCGGPTTQEVVSGWLVEAHYNAWAADESRVTIADVHTDTHNQRVLHVGTGSPRLMVVLVDRGSGPIAFVGLTGSYYEKTTGNMKRLTNEEWRRLLPEQRSPDWTRSFTAEAP